MFLPTVVVIGVRRRGISLIKPEVLEVGRVVVWAGECNRRKRTGLRVFREVDEKIAQRVRVLTDGADIWAVRSPVVRVVEYVILVDLAQRFSACPESILDEVQYAAEIVDVGWLFVWAGRRAPPAN